MDHGGGRQAALGDLRADADRKWRLTASVLRQRLIHPDRIYGNVRGPGDSVFVSRVSGNRARAGESGLMQAIWFCLVAAMLTIYVVLDGYDLGAGIVHLLLAGSDAERRRILQSIGPFWDGNEVWLIAGGGTLYFAFPALYASSFSGFYLPLMMVLWLLMLRGISIEFRSHVESPVWRPLWDVVFGGASTLLTIFFGAALGNVVRGVPLDAS